jgi:DNA-directed RNA polymerase subunit H (RpoH/RPB5)
LQQLPRIREDDPVVVALKAKKEDVIRIKRKSPVGGEYNYYRVVFGEIKK